MTSQWSHEPSMTSPQTPNDLPMKSIGSYLEFIIGSNLEIIQSFGVNWSQWTHSMISQWSHHELAMKSMNTQWTSSLEVHGEVIGSSWGDHGMSSREFMEQFTPWTPNDPQVTRPMNSQWTPWTPNELPVNNSQWTPNEPSWFFSCENRHLICVLFTESRNISVQRNDKQLWFLRLRFGQKLSNFFRIIYFIQK